MNRIIPFEAKIVIISANVMSPRIAIMAVFLIGYFAAASERIKISFGKGVNAR